MIQPERRTFADNQRGNTVADAIRAFAAYSGDRWPIAIATGYFDLSGFSVIADALEAAPSVRVLLGTEPHPPRARRSHAQRLAAAEPVSEAVRELEAALLVERDLLPFDAATAAAVERLRAFLRRPTTEVRLYHERFLHGKAFVFGHEAGVIAGSANFTANGLIHNLELDLGQYEPERAQQVRAWFDELWEPAEPYDLAALFAARTAPFEPYAIYLRMLYELYGEERELHDEPLRSAPGVAALRLASFQRLGVLRAQRILDRYGGVLIADGVGLGKTFIAGELLRHTVKERGQRALLVTPASLRDSTWERFRSRYQLYVENVSYQELAADAQVGVPASEGGPAERRPHLDARADEYRLVVVDEAHAFRNPETFHYRALRRLMAAGATPKDLVLLTATPVNNSLLDLYHQVMLFARHEAAFADVGIPNLRQRFATALKQDVDDLSPHLLFPVLDAISVRRTRRHVQRYYANEEFGDPPQRINFPRPHLRSCHYTLGTALPGFFDEVADALEQRLTLAVYRADSYRLQPVDTGRQEVLAALLRSQLLKRFESSLGAFRTTLGRLARAHDGFLDRLARGVVLTRDIDLADAADDLDDEMIAAFTDGDLVPAPATLYDAEKLRTDVVADRGILGELIARAERVPPERDPKLTALLAILQRLGQAAERDDRKVILFSYFADTVEYVRARLDALDGDALGPYRGRYATVTGNESPDERQRIVWGFAPRSSEAPAGAGDEPYDLLVATDALAEGQNLQQAGRVINFDLPWNPMRLVQRNGRVDRLNSPHADVYLYSFFPEDELDHLLRLEERLRTKIAQANAAVGVETPPLPGAPAAERVFADVEERIRAIHDEDERVIEAEEDVIDAFSGEVFREELRQALLQGRGPELRAMPWGAGSGQRKAGEQGVVFAARVSEERHWRFVPFGGDAALRNDLLGLLDIARCDPGTERHLPDDALARVYLLWARARQDIHASYMARLDPLSRQAAVPKAQRDAVTLLQSVAIADAAEAIAKLQVPWPQHIARQLRRILRGLEAGTHPDHVASEVIALVEAEGLRAPSGAATPPPIVPEDVHLVCWQVVRN